MGIKNSLLIAKSKVLFIFKKLIIKPKSLAYLHATFHTRDRCTQAEKAYEHRRKHRN